MRLISYLASNDGWQCRVANGPDVWIAVEVDPISQFKERKVIDKTAIVKGVLKVPESGTVRRNIELIQKRLQLFVSGGD